MALDGTRALLLRTHAEEAAQLGAMLAADGMSVLTTASEAEARQLLAAGDFDLVLLSMTAPDVEALRFASSLRASAATRDLPLLLVGDAEQQAQILRGFDLGANDHVIRPVDPNELRARVRNQIRRRRFQESLQNDLDRSLEMAVTDPLTGLRNRRYVRRHLDGLLRGGKGATALLVDVDHFKRINDGFGHASGDHVLQEIALRMQDQLRASDVIGRYGGEEFLVVLDTDVAEEVITVATRLQRSVADMPFRLGDQRVSITISTGVAIAAINMNSDAVISAADTALYRAKRTGRDRVELAQAADLMGPTSSVAAAF